MLQRPANEIVTNPLSMYSRPRQSLVHSSPDKQRPQEFPEMDPYQAQAMLDADDEPKELESRLLREPDSAPSPPRVVESPVSFEAKHVETEKFPVMEPKDPLELPERSPLRPVAHIPITALPPSPEKEQTQEQIESAQMQLAKDSDTDIATTTKDPKKAKKRFTFTQGFFEQKDKDKDKDKDKEKDKNASSKKVLKKNRRRTVSFTKSTDENDTTNEIMANGYNDHDGLMNGHSSDSGENSDFPTNPAVRPLSSGSDSLYHRSKNASKRSMSSDDINNNIGSSAAGKAKSSQLTPLLVPSRPVYGRCACCGKLKRPAGYASELSPVMENENIRTNFSFEAERSRATHDTRNSQDKRRFTPIIPMEVREGDVETGSIRTVQASIAPYEPSLRSTSRMSESEVSMSGGIGDKEKKRRSDSASATRVVRFSSLHAKKSLSEDGSGLEEDNEIIEDSTPVVERNGKLEREVVEHERTSRTESQASSYIRSESQLSRPDSGFALHQPSYEVLTEPHKPKQNRKSMPKQDVISVVGWEKGKRVDEPETPVEDVQTPVQMQDETVKPDDSASVTAPVSPAKERSKDDKRKSRVGGILKALQPRPKAPATTLSEEEMEAKMRKKRASRMSYASTTEEALDMLLRKPQVSPADKENRSPSPGNQLEMSNGNKSKDKLNATGNGRFPQYVKEETKKLGHAPKLSLHLDGNDGGLGSMLPEPNLGFHFARSSNTLRDLVMMNGEKTPDMNAEKMLGVNGQVSQEKEVAQEKGLLGSEVEKAMQQAEENEMEKHRGKVAAESGVLEKRRGVSQGGERMNKAKSAQLWYGVRNFESDERSQRMVVRNAANAEPVPG